MTELSLRKVRTKIRQHRRQYGSKSHIPEDLRKSTAQLAKRHSLSTITTELDVCRESVRRWTRLYTEKGDEAQPNPVDFIEIKAPSTLKGAQPLLPGPQGLMEVVRPDGWVLRLTVGEMGQDLAAEILGGFSLDRRKL